MADNTLRCCVVRDLLPSYVEELTEKETSELLRAHLETCPACRDAEARMRTQVPVEKAPKRALRFLKRVKRTRLVAAVLSAVVAFWCMWWLYDTEFHYANTEAGRLAAVEDYIPQPEDSTMPHGVKPGTPLRAVAWQTVENHLLIFYRADTEENIHGIVHLVKGINGKYRILDASIDPSAYAAGIYGFGLSPKNTDWQLFALAGADCRDIHSAEVHFFGIDQSGDSHRASAIYALSGEDFLRIVETETLVKELGLDDEQVERLYVDEVQLFDKDGCDVTEKYKTLDKDPSWGSGKGTAELGLLYVYMGIVALLGIIFVRYFLRKDP